MTQTARSFAGRLPAQHFLGDPRVLPAGDLQKEDEHIVAPGTAGEFIGLSARAWWLAPPPRLFHDRGPTWNRTLMSTIGPEVRKQRHFRSSGCYGASVVDELFW